MGNNQSINQKNSNKWMNEDKGRLERKWGGRRVKKVVTEVQQCFFVIKKWLLTTVLLLRISNKTTTTITNKRIIEKNKIYKRNKKSKHTGY